MIATLLPWLADALVILGLITLTLAIYGMVRLPDPYSRLHAASKTAFLGVAPILVAALVTRDLAIASRVALVLVVLTLTTPVASHTIGRALYLRDRRVPIARPGGGAAAESARDDEGPA